MKKMIITTTIPGTLFFFSGQCRALSQFYDICAVSTDGEKLHKFGEQEHIRVKCLRMMRNISLLRDFLALLKWIWLLCMERPYIVHGNTPKASLLSMFAAWMTHRPVRIYMCHGIRYQGVTGMKRRLLMTMEKITCTCATQVLCVSEGVRSQFADDGICKLNKSKVIMYGSVNGVDTKYFDPSLINKVCEGNRAGFCKTVVFIGRIVRDKGISELVEAVCRLHSEGYNLQLLLIGGREDKLDALPRETEIAIRDNGFIIEVGRQSDVRHWLRNSWLLALPSYREGFGQVLIEAGAMGVPVVASNIIGCNNVVEEGVNGLLCEPRNADSLYNAILKLLSDEDLYNRIAYGCRNYTIEHFDRDKLQEVYIEYYKGLSDFRF